MATTRHSIGKSSPDVNQAVEEANKSTSFSLHSNSAATLPPVTRMYLKSSESESSYLPSVRKRYADLHNLLRQLSTKLTDLSASVDQEFLSSYRVHMLSIQMEIKDLKMEVEKGEAALKSDGTVAKLEAEVKWFVDECNRLKIHCSSMENDCKQLTDRLQALKDQKLFLSDQLKSIMKRNRVLQAEIGYATKKSTSALEGERTKTVSSVSSERKKTIQTNKSANNLQSDEKIRTLSREESLPKAAKLSMSTPNLLQRLPSRQRTATSLRNTKSQPKLEKAEDLMLQEKTELENFLLSKSKYEYQLERTILDIFREIKERKNEALKKSFTKRYNDNERTIDESGFDPKYDPYLTHNPVIFTAGGISGLGLDQFSDNDRFSTIVKYLINYDTFKEVVLQLQANP